MKNFQCRPLSVRSSALAFLFILASLVACKTDSDPDPAPTGVQGSWQVTAINISPAFNGITDYLALYTLTGDTCPSQTTFVFNENGSIAVNAPAACTATKDELNALIGINNSSTWKVDGNMLILTTGGTSSAVDLTVNATTMSLAESDLDLGDNVNHTVTFVFKRM